MNIERGSPALQLSVEDARYVREKRMEFWRADSVMTDQAQADYGKWLVASMLVVHGGALVALAQSEVLGSKVLTASGWYFVAGLILSLLTGFFAWVNWRIGTVLFDAYADPLHVVDTSQNYPPMKWTRIFQQLTMWSAVIVGLGSIVLVGLGAKAAAGAVEAAPSEGYQLVRGNEETVFRLDKATGAVDACVINDVESGCYRVERRGRPRPLDDLIRQK